jgi:hypothetical protein
MATARSERPRFFEGQYIGAADLAATVDYARELAREGALGGQTWGITIGLDLVEVANASGSFDYFVLPGLAFDGYGRPIVVLSPAPVAASLFAGMPTGNQTVWIRYDETLNRGLRPGWEACDASDAYARVRESFKIEAGPMAQVKDRQSGVEIAGENVADARLALNSVDEDAPLVCDASIPHQTFPADNARWLVPLGVAAWTAGVPGSLAQRSDDAKKVSRTIRRYVGQVAESVYAADGVLRLRDRMTDYDSSVPADAQCGLSAITTDDLVKSVNASTGKTFDRLVGNELVWVEGNMRVTGDARLWGTKLELRKKDGTEGGIPLYIDRAGTTNADGGADLEFALGSTADGKTRLVAGVATSPGFDTKLQLKNDGRLAVGTTIPNNVKTHTILATTDGDTSSAIASAANKLAKLQFAVGPGLAESAHLAFDDAAKKLQLGAGTDLTKFVYLTSGGKLGLQTDIPEQLDADANDLVINSVANVGATLLCAQGFVGRINFADDAATPARRHAGSVLYNCTFNRMEFWTNSAFRIAIDSAGNMGLGQMNPGARLEIDSLTDARTLKLDASQIRADNGGTASQLSVQPNGGGTLFGASLGADQQVFIDGNGRIGVGTTTPFGPIHVRTPGASLQLDTTTGANAALIFSEVGAQRSSLEHDTASDRTRLINGFVDSLVAQGAKVGINIGNSSPTANLHVRGSVAGGSDVLSNHVALIENMAGADADVLALRVGGLANPDTDNRFITFFGSTGRVGRIQGTGSNGISFQSGNADFAECLLRQPGRAAIGANRVVGIRGGLVSLVTAGADALMVTTDRPVVVGNLPSEREEDWETVALVGQVPVMVEGPVAAGDYIVASGRNDGTGFAVAVDAWKPGEAGLVGRAWESSDEEACKLVLVAVGVAGTGDAMARIISDQDGKIERLQAQLDALAARLEG